MTRRALLVSGGILKGANHRRYANDLRLWRKVIERSEEPYNVHSFFADGQCRIFTGMGEVTYFPARYEDITNALHNASNELVQGDTLLIVTSNHGAKDGCLHLWDKDLLAPHDVVSSLKHCEANIIVVMGQCHSGSFLGIAKQLKHCIVVTACQHNGPSYMLECSMTPHPTVAKLTLPANQCNCTTQSIHSTDFDEFLYQMGFELLRNPNTSIGQAFYIAEQSDQAHETPCIASNGLDPQLTYLF